MSTTTELLPAPPITCGNPRHPELLFYFRSQLERAVDDLWADPAVAPHREDLEEIVAGLLMDGDWFTVAEEATEFFGDGMWTDPFQAKNAGERFEMHAQEIADLWHRLARAERSAMRGPCYA